MTIEYLAGQNELLGLYFLSLLPDHLCNLTIF